MTDTYQLRIDDGGPWAKTAVANEMTCTFTEAMQAARQLAAETGREVRMNAVGSYQGHYWLPPVHMEVITAV